MSTDASMIFDFLLNFFIYFKIGTPPELKTWVYQCGAYMCVMLIEKCVILAFFQLKFWKDVKKIILLPFDGHPNVEVVIVVLIVPFIMNVRKIVFSCYA